MRKYLLWGSTALALAGCETARLAPRTAPSAAPTRLVAKSAPSPLPRNVPSTTSVILAAAVQPVPALAPVPPDAPLTLAGLEQLALRYNPTLVQAGVNVEDARGRVVQSGLYPNPTVGYIGEQIGLRGDHRAVPRQRDLSPYFLALFRGQQFGQGNTSPVTGQV